MKSISKVIAQTGLAVVLGAGAVAANADLITKWDFTVTGEWSVGDTVFSAGDGVTFEDPSLLSWGADNGTDPINTGDRFTSRSGLEVGTSPVMGEIDTNAGPVDTIDVTHFNNTIAATFARLETAVFITTLTLTPLEPLPGAPIGPVTQNIPIMFSETLNQADCGFDSVSNCDDIFVFMPGSLDFSFDLDGFTYTTQIGAPGLGLLPPATCAAADAGPGPCLGLTTPEQEASTVVFNFSISGRPSSVPAPATLALLGAGLLGFAARKRARRA